MREQRWCLCGWSTTGTEQERFDAFANHWVSRRHRRRMVERRQPVGVESIGEAR